MFAQLLESVNFSAKQVDFKPAPWANEYRPHWLLSFRVDKARARFDFWNNYLNEPPSKLEMLGLLIGEAISGEESFEDFCSEFGYDEDSRTAERTWKACGKCAEKIRRLFPSVDLYDLGNYIRELTEAA